MRRPIVVSTIGLAALFIFSSLTATASAQSTDASVRGVILDADGAPIAGAQVELRNASTGFRTLSLTGAEGRFTFNQLPLGGPYTLTATMLGFADVSQGDIELSLGDRVELSLVLASEALVLEGFEVTAEVGGFQARDRRLAAATSVTQSDLRALPTPRRTFTNLAQLSPLVAGGQNIFGQNARNNSILIDGVNAREAPFGGEGSSPFKLSMEALREFEVVTNSYDVTDGRGAFGGIRATTRSGTNQFQGSLFGFHQDERLAARQDLMGREVIGDTRTQRGFTFSGPVLRDRLHFFVAYDGERFDQQFDLWAQHSGNDFFQSNAGGRISSNDMDRLLRALPQYGINSDQQQIGFFQRTVSLDTWFARLDWQINDRHRLTFRTFVDEYSEPDRNNSDIGAHGIFASSYDFTNEGTNSLLHLRSQLSPNTLNELRLGYFVNDRGNRITTARHPQLWVISQSEVNGAMENFTFIPRYNRWTPETQIARTFNLTNTTHTRWRGNDVVFGTDNTWTISEGIYTHDTAGRYDFFSIEAFEEMRPDRFRRKHTNPGQELEDPVQAGLVELSVFGQFTRELRPHLEASLGLRYDVALFSTAADYNELLDQELGYRNDVNPVDWSNVQPRLNLFWDRGGQGVDIVSAGAGLFMGQVTTRPYLYSLIDNGIRFTGVDIRRGDTFADGRPVELPTPDYDAYADSYANIPGDGLTARDLGQGSEAQVVRFLDADLKMPRALRAHASYHRYLTPNLRVGGAAYLTRTTRMPVMENVNLPREVSFRVEGEGGREVYVPVDEVGSRAVARISDQFADALMYTNGYSTRSRSLVLDAAAALFSGGSFYASYTLNESRGAEAFRNEDDQRFVGGSYFDGYSHINRGFAPNDFRHKILLNLTSPEIGGWQLGTFLNLTQQGRFSALVGRYDLSGTRIRSETGYAAFVFDPADPRTRELQGDQFVSDLQWVLDNAHPNAARYLRENFGQYAVANGGIQPWRTQLDLRLSNEIELGGRQRLQVSIDAFNLLNLINDSWGGRDNIYNTAALYNVTGFDPSTRTFRYTMNREWGQSRKEGSGFYLALGARWLF
ncbi:MAG: hypothetical protein EA422_12995 [Gemmatimonadales bacterium]|nr:MAG: hypothetical protein EA422_12995 [Gemmatimonadales bacterium]